MRPTRLLRPHPFTLTKRRSCAMITRHMKTRFSVSPRGPRRPRQSAYSLEKKYSQALALPHRLPTMQVDDAAALVYGTAWKEEATRALTLLALEAGFTGIDTANQRRHYHEAAVG